MFLRHWFYSQTVVHDTLKHRPGQLQKENAVDVNTLNFNHLWSTWQH